MAMQLSGGIQVKSVSPSNISTYGAIILPFDYKEEQPIINAKETTKFTGKLRSALNLSPDKNLLLGAIKSPLTTFNTLSKYMKDERSQMSKLTTVIGSKFSGIAVAQAITSGKVTSKEALDYLFMGFAPALGMTGSLFGYSGLNQLKDALANGSIDVGSFINGFTRTLKGAVDLKDNLKNKVTQTSGEVVLIDLTLSHSENYQSETPDRRVESGQSLNEYIHNMPETFTLNCALQENKRYSKPEFRAIMQLIRNNKRPVQLVLGDEVFDDLVLTDFSPNNDCTKSGMDYTLSFKKILQSNIDTSTEVTIMETPPELAQSGNSTGGTGSLGSNGAVLGDVKDAMKYTSEKMKNTGLINEDGTPGTMLYGFVKAVNNW